jgi:hypothetical protein
LWVANEWIYKKNPSDKASLILIFLIGVVGVGVQLRPLLGLLYQPRVIMMMEKLVE